MRNADSCFSSKPMSNELPCTDILPVLPARKFRQTEDTRLISNRCLRPRPTEGCPWSEQLREPAFVIWMIFLIGVGFELKTCRLKLTEGGDGGRRELVVAVNEAAGIWISKTQCSQSGLVMYA